MPTRLALIIADDELLEAGAVSADILERISEGTKPKVRSMQKYNGKFQKQQSKNKNRLILEVGIFAMVAVLFLLGIVLYKMGELPTIEAQKVALETEVIQQQTAQEVTQPAEAIPVTEMPSTEPTEVTAAPFETTVAYV